MEFSDRSSLSRSPNSLRAEYLTMMWIAIKMLVADPAKFAGLVFGIAFSTLLIAQQSSFGIGLINTSPGVLYEVDEADIWVMDPRVESVDAPVPIADLSINRVRGVDGVAWAAPYMKAQVSIEGANGLRQNASLIGVDDVSLAGLPQSLRAGTRTSLRQPGAIFMDESGFRLLWPGEAPSTGKVLEINDIRVFIAGIVASKPQFGVNIVLYGTLPTAARLVPSGRRTVSYVLARVVEGATPDTVCIGIARQTGLKALTRAGFIRSTIGYILRTTAIAQSFGLIVLLGVVVGIVIVGLTLSLFIRDNLSQFAALRAIGVSGGSIRWMVVVQSGVVAWSGFGIGMGLTAAAIRGIAENAPGLRTLFLPWEVSLATGVLQSLVIMASARLCLRRVLKVDPATVFRT